MPKQTINLLLRSKILVALIAGVLLLLGILQVAQGFIETRDYRAQVVQAVKERVGKEIVIHGKVSVTLVPPALYLPGVELRDADPNSTSPSLTVEMLRVNAVFLSLFSGTPEVSGVILQKPILEIERAKNNKIDWGWLNIDLIRWLGVSSATGKPIGIEISEGRIFYRNNQTDYNSTLENINVSGASGQNSQLNGSFDAGGYHIKFSQDSGGSATTNAADWPVNIKLYTDDNSILEMKGSVNTSSDVPKINADLTVKTKNLISLLLLEEKDDKKAVDQITNESVRKDTAQAAMPLELNAKWQQEGWDIHLGDIKLNGLGSVATGDVKINWGDLLDISATTNFSVFNYDTWRDLLQKAFLSDDSQASSYHTAGGGTMSNPLPRGLKLSLNLNAQEVTTGEQKNWKNAQFSAVLDNAAITINQMNIELPGQSTLTLFGLVSQGGTTKGLKFDGSMETQGKSLRDMLTVFDPSAAELPETGLGNFYARSNLFVSSEKILLSEADVRISDLHLNGGLAGYFDENPRLEADVRLKDINFDYFRNVWREKQKTVEQKTQFLTFDKNMKFGWLNKLKTTIDFKVIVDQFTFLDRQGYSASFRLFAREGEFGIYNLRFYYPTEVMEASFNIDIKNDRPFFNVLLNTREFNTDYLSVELDKKDALQEAAGNTSTPVEVKNIADSQEKPKQPADAGNSLKPKWSEDLIDMSWMEGIGGAFDISIGKLVHKDTEINDLKVRAQLENNTLNVQSLNFSYWGGRCEATGSLFGGRVPGFSVGFNMVDADLQDILKSTVGRENITGKANISGTVSTSGVNSLSWVSQAEAKAVLSARGVVVNGLNLQGVIDAVSVARTAADVFNNVNLALTNGWSELAVDGNINVLNGVIRTPGITLKTGNITGNLTGEIKLVPWTISLSTFFQFPGMTSETVPTMTVQLDGKMETPSLQTDTSSLEAYVAKRIVGR